MEVRTAARARYSRLWTDGGGSPAYVKTAFLAHLVILTGIMACLAPLPTPEGTRGPSGTANATILANVPMATTAGFPTLTPGPNQATTNPASRTFSRTPKPTTSATILVITISSIPTNIPEYDRPQWPDWTDEDGDCQNARQHTLAAESVVPVTFETAKNCRVATGQWRGPYTGVHEYDPHIVAVDHPTSPSSTAPTMAGIACRPVCWPRRSCSSPTTR